MLKEVTYMLRVKKVFERERGSLEVRALGIILVYPGLSYRKVAQVISFFEKVSHEAIRLWYHKASHIFSLTPECKERRAIAIDETKIKIGNKWHYIWVYTSAVEGHILMLKSS